MMNRKEKIKIILKLAVPTMIENFLLTMVGFVDTLFVSKIGLHEVTAVGMVNAIIAVYIAVFTVIGIGTASLIARSVGAGEIGKAKAIAKQSTWVSAAAGLLIGMITLIFAEPLLLLMGTEPDILVDAVIYFQISAVPSLFLSLMTIFGSVLRSAGDSRSPMMVGIWINLIHIGLDYILIFGTGAWDGWGIAGAAWATTIARMIGAAALFGYIRRSQLSFSMRIGNSSSEYVVPLLKISGPAAAERLIMRLGQLFYMGLIIKIGTDVYAAHLIGGNIISLSYLPGYGLGVAAATLVGQHFGANRKRDAYEYGVLTAVIAAVFMTIVGILFFILSPIAATWFTDDQAIVGMVRTALGIDAFAQPFLAVSLVLAGALQGIGDTKSPMYSTAVGIWLVRTTFVYVLGLKLGMGIAGVWLANAIDLTLRSIYLSWRFKKQMKSCNRSLPIVL